MTILPFPASRPTRDKAALVTCRAYEAYGAAELAAQLDYNPFSFLHVLHPGYVNVQQDNQERRFGKVRDKYQEFSQQQVLVKEESAMYYLYELQSGGRTFTGIVAALPLEDYRNGKIRKHEDTLEYRVDQFSDYLNTTRFNTEPILVAYPENARIDRFITEKKRNRPLYHFSTMNREVHTIWRIKYDGEMQAIRQAFASIDAFYIADGHHRCASADALFTEHPELPGASAVMAFLIPEREVVIHGFHRLIRWSDGGSVDGLLQQLSAHFHINARGREFWEPERNGQFGLYIQGNFYELELKKASADIDAETLNRKIIAPFFGITDLRTDARIDYLPGNVPLTKLTERVDSGEFDLALLLHPISFTEIRGLADKGEILPPKSTYIEPKFRSGLIIYDI